jgi:hypothetical protein
MMKRLALAALFIAEAATAQVTTVCTPDMLGGVVCREQYQMDTTIPLRGNMNQPDSGENFWTGYQRGIELKRQREAMEQNQRDSEARQQASMAIIESQQQAQSQVKQAQDTRRNVGQLLAYKQCDRAIATALEAGDIELAATARKFCEGDKAAGRGIGSANR